MAENLAIRSRAESPELKKAASSIEQAAWNEFGYLNYTRAHYEHYQDLLDAYPDYQLCLVDEESGYPVAVANCVPFGCSGPDDLPPEGWDWVVETAARSKGARLNMLGALAISVPAVHRSKGYARLMIRALIDLAETKGLRGLVAPVRPSAKVRHPWIPIAEYLSWTDPKGRVYDPSCTVIDRSHGPTSLPPDDKWLRAPRLLGELVQAALRGNRPIRAARWHHARKDRCGPANRHLRRAQCVDRLFLIRAAGPDRRETLGKSGISRCAAGPCAYPQNNRPWSNYWRWGERTDAGPVLGAAAWKPASVLGRSDWVGGDGVRPRPY